MNEVISDSEEKRLNAIRKYQILDTPPDGNFDRLATLAAKVFNMPICIISLVDTDRIWFKSHYGLNIKQISREPGLCASAILADDVYIVENATEDPRTLTNPLVTSEFGLRFYAAAPLTTSEGYNLGTFCIIDQKQRYLTEAQQQVLQEFASIAMDEIELRLAARNAVSKMHNLLDETKKDLQNLIHCSEQATKIVQDSELDDCIKASKENLKKINIYLNEISVN